MKSYEYQQRRMKSYLLPRAVYKQAVWALKDLIRLEGKLEELRQRAYYPASPDFAKVCAASLAQVRDTTGDMACQLQVLEERIEAMKTAAASLPEKYREGVVDRLVLDVPFGDRYHLNTWQKWQQVFVYHVAVNLGLL